MAQHLRHHQFDTGQTPEHAHVDDAGLAELLDLDAEVLGSYLGEVTEWLGRYTDAPRTVVDVGAGTGTGSLALARAFPTADVVAIDRSASMLGRVEAAARSQGLDHRLSVVQADLDVAWPSGVFGVDVAWASSSLHEVADPDRLIRDVRKALDPGGLLVVVEMDSLPRFLPDDVGVGRPGLEVRCHEALARAGWNAHPSWEAHLERAGLQVVGRRAFTTEGSPGQPVAGRFAHAYLSRVGPALEGRVGADDLSVLDRLLAGDDPSALLRQGDLTVRGRRTAWVARRPVADSSPVAHRDSGAQP